MAYQETASEQIERYKVIPSFAKDFRNLSLEQQMEVFQDFGIKHPVHRKMFEFLCVVIQDALIRTGRSFTTYKYYADSVLKWASNPNNLRSMPGFPRSEDIFKTNFNPLLDLLVEKGVVIVTPGIDGDEDRRTISFAYEEKIRSSSDLEEYNQIQRLLENEFAKIKTDNLIPFPSRRQVEKALKREISEKIQIKTIEPREYTKADLGSLKKLQVDFFQIDFDARYQVLVPIRELENLKEIAATRLVAGLQDLNLVKKLDQALAASFPGDSPPTITNLFAVKLGRFPAFDQNAKAWLVVVKHYLDEVRVAEGSTPGGRAKYFPILLFGHWLASKEAESRRSATQVKLFEGLYAFLAGEKRFVTLDELHASPLLKDWVSENPNDQVSELLEKFFQTYSVVKNPRKPDTLIQLDQGAIQSKQGLDFFINWFAKSSDQVARLAETHWVEPLAKGHAGSEIKNSIESDDLFNALFAKLVLDLVKPDPGFYLFDLLLNFFSSYPQALQILASRSGVAVGRFLAQAGDGRFRLKPLTVLLGWSKERVLEEVEPQIPLMRKLVLAFKGFLGRDKTKVKKPKVAKKTQARSSQERSEPPASGQTRRSKRPGKVKKAETPPAKRGSPLPKGYQAITADEQYQLLAKGRSREQHLAGWNRQLGQAAEDNRRIVSDIINERLGPIKRRLKAGGKTIDLEPEVFYTANNKRLESLPNRESLLAYIGLTMLENLEDFRKANRLSFGYLVKK